jgi:hypothetical protein
MYRSPHKLIGLLSIGALGLVIGVTACTQPGATPSAMMEASPTGMMMEASPTGMMMEASPTGMMMEESPSAGQ